MAVDGSMPDSSTMLPSTAAPVAIRVLLRDTKRYDSFEVREFDLPLNSTFPIGRASKNSAKQDLLPSPSNAFIDSPVISRDHAVLTANTTSGIPRVYITDSGSMHGTMLNGRRLVPNTPETLSPGDVLQFGIDVNRNDEFFVARNYEFDAHPATPYSLGFTVPDPESEDEVEVIERRGSQQNPLMIDDSDSASEASTDEQLEVTIAPEAILNLELPPAPPFAPQHQEDRPPSPMRTSFVDEKYSDDEDDVPSFSGVSESDGEEFGLDMDSEAGSVASSEAEYGSDQEMPDSEDEGLIPVDSFKFVSPYTSVTEHVHSLPTNIQPTVQPRDIYNLEDMAGSQAPGLPPLPMLNQSYTTICGFGAPPLPPRPSAPKQAPWHFNAYPQQHDSQVWYPDQMSYLGTNFGDRPSIFSPAPPPPHPVPESFEPRTCGGPFGAAAGPIQSENRLQTPPPAPAADVMAVTPPPNRRTKVFSIEEIVEEQPQPPTPTSLNGTKRKADVLEEEESLPVAVSSPNPEEANELFVDTAAAAAAAAAAEAAAIIARRPKKQPRSLMGKVFRGASYPLLGAAGAVVSFTLLSTLPDAFFGA